MEVTQSDITAHAKAPRDPSEKEAIMMLKPQRSARSEKPAKGAARRGTQKSERGPRPEPGGSRAKDGAATDGERAPTARPSRRAV